MNCELLIMKIMNAFEQALDMKIIQLILMHEYNVAEFNWSIQILVMKALRMKS